MELPSFLYDLTGEGDRPSLEYANEIFSMLEVVKMRKKEVLLHLGEVADSIYIVKSGILKGSIIDEFGKMHTVRFVAEGSVMTSMYSFIDQKPSELHIEYVGLSPAFYKLMLKRYHDMVDEKSRMISDDATTRYLKFMERYAFMVDRLPLKEVASFLGIRQQSLSRLRGKMNESIG
jgi:CRP-like cAMP-binding protein